MLAAWESLYDFVKPDCILNSYAPVSLLAARLRHISIAITATGFELPPDQTPVPSLRPWANTPLRRLQVAEQRVVDTLNHLGKARGFQLKRYRELFDVDKIFLNTFKELNHYETRGPADYCGPLFVNDTGAIPVWPEGRGRRIFAYLRPEMRELQAVLEAIKNLDVCLLLAAPGLSAAGVGQFSSACVKVVPGPVSIGETLKQAEVVISYAGHGLCAQSLLAGRPMLLFPQHLEQVLVARLVIALGAGLVPRDPKPETIAETLSRLLEEPVFTQRAQAFAKRYADYSAEESSVLMAAEIDRLATKDS